MANFPLITPQLGIKPLAPGPTGLAAVQAEIDAQRARNAQAKTPDLSGLGKAIAAGYGLINGSPSGLPTPPLAGYPDLSNGAMGELNNSILAPPSMENAAAQNIAQDGSGFVSDGFTADGTGAVDSSLSSEGASALGDSGVASGGAEAGTDAAASGAGEGAADATAGSGLLPAAGIVAGAYTGVQQARGLNSLAHGDNPSAIQHAALFPITGGFDNLVGPVKRFFGSGKGPDQQARDQVRKTLQEKGVIDENFQIENPDGSKFNIGKDGKNQAYNVDLTKKDAGAVVGLLNPAGFLVSNGNKKLNSDFTGYFANAALSSDDKLQAVRNIYQKLGITKDSAIAKINAAQVQGTLSKEEAAAYINSTNIVFSDTKTLPTPPDSTTAEQG